MGQLPFLPPNVKGWPGGRVWINTSTLFVRYNTCVPWPARRTVAGRSAEKMVDYWVSRLIQPHRPGTPPVAARVPVKNPIGDSIRRMVQLIVSMPEYQLC